MSDKAILKRLLAAENNVSQLARDLDVNRQMIYRWEKGEPISRSVKLRLLQMAKYKGVVRDGPGFIANEIEKCEHLRDQAKTVVERKRKEIAELKTHLDRL